MIVQNTMFDHQTLHDISPNIEYYRYLQVLRWLQYGASVLVAALIAALLYYVVWFLITKYWLAPIGEKIIQNSARVLSNDKTDDTTK